MVAISNKKTARSKCIYLLLGFLLKKSRYKVMSGILKRFQTVENQS